MTSQEITNFFRNHHLDNMDTSVKSVNRINVPIHLLMSLRKCLAIHPILVEIKSMATSLPETVSAPLDNLE